MIPTDSPFHDAARPILEAENLDQETKAQIWDIYHSAPDAASLAKAIAPLAIPSDDLKHRLFIAKIQSAPPVTPVDAVTSAIQKMATLDPAILDKAEKYPAVLRAIVTAKE